VVVFVVRNYLDGAAKVWVVGEVFAEQLHLLGGALFGDSAVGQVADDVPLRQWLVCTQLLAGEADALLLQKHHVVGVLGDWHRAEPALTHQGSEDPAVLVLVHTVPGDLGTQLPMGFGDQRCNPVVLLPALGLTAGGNGAEQPERFVVAEDLLEQASGREHHRHLSTSIRKVAFMSPGAPARQR
jgi:hypothetical protein